MISLSSFLRLSLPAEVAEADGGIIPPSLKSPLTNGDTEVARRLLGEAELNEDLRGELFLSPLFSGVVLPFLDRKGSAEAGEGKGGPGSLKSLGGVCPKGLISLLLGEAAMLLGFVSDDEGSDLSGGGGHSDVALLVGAADDVGSKGDGNPGGLGNPKRSDPGDGEASPE